MKRLALSLFAFAALAATAQGCAYGGVATAGDKAVVLRNDAFLFGALRKAFVCKISDSGLSNCQAGDAP